MRGFLFAISALVIGAFFTVWTIQRGGDVAVLKALGASTQPAQRRPRPGLTVSSGRSEVGSALSHGACGAIGGVEVQQPGPGRRQRRLPPPLVSVGAAAVVRGSCLPNTKLARMPSRLLGSSADPLPS
jgi:hypothetical protein